MRSCPELLHARVTATEKAAVEKAAEKAGLPVSTYIRRLITKDLASTEETERG